MQLNPQQQIIVDHPVEGSALVMAGAGSGKTTVIARRALALVGQLEPGSHLQMLTFSNKAAKEMKERVIRLGGRSCLDVVKFDTFHSYGLKLIKDDYAGYGLSEGFSLLNETDCMRALRLLAKEYGLAKNPSAEDRKRLNPVAWFGTWSLARQAGFDVNNPRNKGELCRRLQQEHQLRGDEVELAWKTLSGYEAQKRQANGVDFDDLLYLPLLRVAREDEYRAKVRNGLGYVVIDEAQDTNRIQYELIRHIALGHCGVTCVGDDDQSIYGWRGAEVSNLKRFVSHFRAAELRLEQNYRSTQAIVEAAADLIKNNQDRLDKSPFSEGAVGEKPKAYLSSNHYEMADSIAERIAAGIAQGRNPNEFAILYRTNRMAMLIEQSMRRYKVPYHVVGGMSLFDRSEVVAVTSAMRLAANPTDIFSLKSIQPYIDGFGAASSFALSDWLTDEVGASLLDLPDEIPNLPKRGLAAFKAFYEDLRSEAVFSESAADFIKWVVHGPMAVLEREKDEQLRERKAHHLASLARDIEMELNERKVAEPELTWRSVILEVALRDARQSEAEQGQVTLSTVHRSKGLEWDEVYVAGFSEGLMPLDSRTELAEDDAACGHVEEERRLAYVAVTRARKHCHLHHADTYAFPGGREDKVYEPSRFFAEMGMESYRPSLEANNADDFDFSQFEQEFLGLARGMR